MLIIVTSSTYFARRKGTSRRVVPNLRLGFKRKVNMTVGCVGGSQTTHRAFSTIKGVYYYRE